MHVVDWNNLGEGEGEGDGDVVLEPPPPPLESLPQLPFVRCLPPPGRQVQSPGHGGRPGPVVVCDTPYTPPPPGFLET